MKILLVASGGGHTGYAVAVAEQLIRTLNVSTEDVVFLIPRNDKWSFMRIKKRISKPIVYQSLKPRNPNEPIHKIITGLPIALKDSWNILREVDIVVCTGSNHSLAPAVLAKLRYRIPVICIEAVDRVVTASKTVKLLYEGLDIPVAIHWIEQKKNYPNGILVGPIYEEPVYKPTNKGYILVTTGSMGHEKLFNILLKTSLENVVVQTGRIDPRRIRKQKPQWIAFSFDPDIDKWIAGASLVITHQGLTAVEAALAYGKPVVIAYNPDLPMTSTLVDTYYLARKINAKVINPAKLEPAMLEELVYRAEKNKPPRIPSGAKKLALIIKHTIEEKPLR
ncbi:MAG: glycosyltransferase [Thermoprotei archaeon]